MDSYERLCCIVSFGPLGPLKFDFFAERLLKSAALYSFNDQLLQLLLQNITISHLQQISIPNFFLNFFCNLSYFSKIS